MVDIANAMTKVEPEAWWIERLCGRGSAMPATDGDPTPSSSRWRDPSPASSAPSLPAAELDFWPPVNHFPTHFGHCDKSTEMRHSTATQSTQLPSSRTLSSSLASCRQSSQSLNNSCGAERHCAQPRGDSLSSKPMAQQRRPLGCGLGSSICPKTPRSSILATSLSLSRDEEDGALASATEVWAAMCAAQRGPASRGRCCIRNDGLGDSEHASWQRTVAQARQARPLPASVPYEWSPVPSPRFPAL